MEKKYYDLIVSLIKEHRKYPGCENILDDIAEDVYSHSKVVIGSITNEEVLISYFKKVISTSIVTVPKKLNVSVRTSRSTSAILESCVKQSDNVVNEFKTSEVTVLEEALEKDEELTNISTIEEALDSEETELFIETSEEFVPEINTDVEPESKNLEKVDKSLVDKMINGIVFSENEETKIENKTFETLETENAIDESLCESLDLDNEKIIDQDNSIDTIDELVIEAEEEQEELQEIEEELAIEAEEEQEELQEIEEELAIEAEEEQEELQEIEEELVIEAEEEQEELQEIEEELVIEAEEEQEELQETIAIEFSQPSYECFSYEPEVPDFDTSEIFYNLEDIDNRHPEKQILNICDLKYNKNKSVKEIATTLNLTEEDVIITLSEIVDNVKD